MIGEDQNKNSVDGLTIERSGSGGSGAAGGANPDARRKMKIKSGARDWLQETEGK